jgi:hypothetical protein
LIIKHVPSIIVCVTVEVVVVATTLTTIKDIQSPYIGYKMIIRSVKGYFISKYRYIQCFKWILKHVPSMIVCVTVEIVVFATPKTTVIGIVYSNIVLRMTITRVDWYFIS